MTLYNGYDVITTMRETEKLLIRRNLELKKDELWCTIYTHCEP